MSTQKPHLPSLTSWVQSRFTTLMQAPSDSADVNPMTTLDSIFAPNAQFIVNHNSVPFSFVKETFTHKLGQSTDVHLEWKHTTEVPAEEGENAALAGIVAAVFVVTRTLKLKVEESAPPAPKQIQNFITFHAKIEQVPTVQPDENGDRRRIVHIFETSLEKPVPPSINES